MRGWYNIYMYMVEELIIWLFNSCHLTMEIFCMIVKFTFLFLYCTFVRFYIIFGNLVVNYLDRLCFHIPNCESFSADLFLLW